MRDGVDGVVASVRARRRRRLDPDRRQPAAVLSARRRLRAGCGGQQLQRARPRPHQRLRAGVRDVATRARQVPDHAARLRRARLLLRLDATVSPTVSHQRCYSLETRPVSRLKFGSRSRRGSVSGPEFWGRFSSFFDPEAKISAKYWSLFRYWSRAFRLGRRRFGLV